MKGFSSNPKPKINKKTYTSQTRKVVNQAFELQQNARLDEALVLYEMLLKRRCKDPTFLTNYGVLLKRKREFTKAKELFEEAIKLYPKRSESYSNIALIMSMEGKQDQAITYIKKALLLEPKNTTYLYNHGIFLFRNGQLNSAKSVFKELIRFSPDYDQAYAELAILQLELSDIDAAERLIRKAISLNSSKPSYHSNLASILTTKGQFFEAGESALKALTMKSSNAKPLYIVSNSKSHSSNEFFLNQLFSSEFETSLSEKNKVDLFFGRANILHRQSKFDDASRYLLKANDIKLSLYPSDAKKYIRVTKRLLELAKKITYQLDKNNRRNPIFIVGMPRSGSTLTESIISMNNMVVDLGECQFFEQAFVESGVSKDIQNINNIEKIYYEKVNQFLGKNLGEDFITTDKQLYNFAYIPFIVSQLPEAKIIHCIRNPLDNILSIYRAHFAKESRYASSLKDCVHVYELQDKIMSLYKTKFSKNIFTLDYDQLVSAPEDKIRRLIGWLDWEWNDIYLNPHLNKRSVSTASSTSVRSPINNKSVGGWKKYQSLLKPAIEQLSKISNYQHLFQ